MSIENEKKDFNPKPIIVNPQGNLKYVNPEISPTTNDIDGDDTDKLKAMRLVGLFKELEKIENRQKEAFYNRIQNLNLSVDNADDAEKIKKMEIFIDYYFISNNYALFAELCNGELELTSPQILTTVILFDKLYYSHKWDIRRIIDYFVRQNDDFCKVNKMHAIEFKKEIDSFYNTVILKKSERIN